MGLFPNPVQRYAFFLIYANIFAFFYKKIAFFYNHKVHPARLLHRLGCRPTRGLRPRCVVPVGHIRGAMRSATHAAGPSYRMPPSSGRV